MSKVTVAVVDDSAVIRGLLKSMLSEDNRVQVIGTASNGQLGVDLCAKEQPDICIMDVEMPVLDGISALKKIREKAPDTKVIMCPTLTQKNAEISMQALELGALDTIAKPSSTTELHSKEGFQAHLLKLVCSVAPARPSQSGKTETAPAVEKDSGSIKLRPQPLPSWRPKIIAIGSSTGGPQALFDVLRHLKGKTSAPILITQHMPPTFTKTLASHITTQTGLTCHEAEDGMRVEAGKAYLAKGGMHMVLKKTAAGLSLALDDGPPEHFCKPSVEPMFRSIIDSFPAKDILGVMLTGMGSDGVNEGTRLADMGGAVIAQDEETSVVWGMPGAVAKAGACCAVLPLGEIGPFVSTRME